MMREQAARAGRAEVELETAIALIEKLKEELATRNRGQAHEHEQLIYFRRRTRTHVNEVCATLNQVHKLQIGSELLEAGDTT